MFVHILCFFFFLCGPVFGNFSPFFLIVCCSFALSSCAPLVLILFLACPYFTFLCRVSLHFFIQTASLFHVLPFGLLLLCSIVPIVSFLFAFLLTGRLTLVVYLGHFALCRFVLPFSMLYNYFISFLLSLATEFTICLYFVMKRKIRRERERERERGTWRNWFKNSRYPFTEETFMVLSLVVYKIASHHHCGFFFDRM